MLFDFFCLCRFIDEEVRKKMINLFIAVVIFILLVTQNVLLLNEESLILLCFIVFVNIGMMKLGESIKLSLDAESTEVNLHLVESLNKLLLIIKGFTSLSINSKHLLKKYFAIKKYYKTLTSILSNYFPTYNKNSLNKIYLKKLIFLNKIEVQTIKLLTTIIIRKLSLVVRIKYFYVNYL